MISVYVDIKTTIIAVIFLYGFAEGGHHGNPDIDAIGKKHLKEVYFGDAKFVANMNNGYAYEVVE